MQSKLSAYFGFAKRAGQLTLGVNAAGTLKKCALLVADERVGKNSRKEIEKLKEKLACPLLFCGNLGELVARQGCMLAAVREEHLAEAIIKELGENSAINK